MENWPWPAPRPRAASATLLPGSRPRPTFVVPRVQRREGDQDSSGSSGGSSLSSRRIDPSFGSRSTSDVDIGLDGGGGTARYYNEALQPLARLIVEDGEGSARRRSLVGPRPSSPDSPKRVTLLTLGRDDLDRCLGLYLGAASQGMARCACARLRRRGASPVGLCALERQWLDAECRDEAFDAALRRNACDCGGPSWTAIRTAFARGAACLRWRARHVEGVAARLQRTSTARRDAEFARVVDSLAKSARVRFAAVRRTKVGHLDPDFLGPALRPLVLSETFLANLSDDAFATGSGFVGLVIERVDVSLALFGSSVVLLIESACFEEATHGKPPTTVTAESVRFSVESREPTVLFARTRTTPPQEQWSATAWALFAEALSLDAASGSAKSAVRNFAFGVAESIGGGGARECTMMPPIAAA